MALAHFVKILTRPKARGVKILAGPTKKRLRKILMGPEIQNTDEDEEQKSNDEARKDCLVNSKTKILMGPSACDKIRMGPIFKILMGPIFKTLTESRY